MPAEIQCRVCDYDFHLSVQSASGVPAGVGRLPGVSLDYDFILLAMTYFFRDVDLKSEIAIIGPANIFAVQEYIAYEHYAFKIK